MAGDLVCTKADEKFSVAISNSSEQKRAANWVLVWSAGPGPSAGVDSKTKMAAASCSNSDNSKNVVVSLSEDDIPGAKLPREIPEQCNVQQLKQWLSGRGACVCRKKPQLIARFVYTFIRLSLYIWNLTAVRII